MAKRILLSIGTKKGLFIAESTTARQRFRLRGPFGSGVSVYSTLLDARGTPQIYASSCNAFFGMKVLRSRDLGHTFQETKGARLPERRRPRAGEHLVPRAGQRRP